LLVDNLKEREDIATEESSARTASPVPAALLRLVERFGLVIVFLGVVVAFGTNPKTGSIFLTKANLSVVVGSQSVLAIIAIGAMIPLIAGEFDFSVGSNAGLCSVFSAAYLAENGANIFVGVAIAIGLGALVGIVNGIIVVHLKVTSLIATLGTSTIISGIVLQYTSGTSIVNVPRSLTDFGDGDSLGLPNTLWVLVAVGIATIYLIEYTPFGRYLHSIGSNRRASVLVGIAVPRLVFLTYVVSGVFAGAAGALLVARLGGANPQTGFDYTLPAVAAVFLGATTIRPGKFNTVGTFVAVFFLAALSSGLNLYGAPSYAVDYINGGALVVGVAISALLAARRRKGAI
jgi:ribose transport system permease protein